MVQAGVSWAQKHSLKPVLVHHEPIEEYSHLLTLSGLSLRVWMASMTFPSVMLTTDSAPLHIAGYMNVPTAAMFNYTSGNVVPKWYPTVVPFDLHRNRPGGLACSPCYHWSNCHYLKQDGLMPLKCVRDITDEQVVDALDKAWDLEKKPYNYSVYDGFDVDNKIIRLDGGMPKPQDSPTPKTKMDVLVLTIQDKSDEQAIIACVIATSVRNVFEKLKIITSPITDNQEKIIKACPYLSVSKINDVGVDYFVEIKLSDAIGHRNGWWAYVSNIVGCSTSVTAVFSSSTSVVNRMWDSFGDRLISFCDEGLVIDNTPVEDIVYDNEYLSWDERIAIIRIASKVVTSKPAIAMIGSLVGVDTTYKGDPKDVTGFDRMVIL